MSDFMITVGVIKVMGSSLLFVAALLFALNRSAVQVYFEKYITRSKTTGFAVAVVTDYINVLVFAMASSVMRMISGTAVFVGEYSELLEVRVVGIISYLLDIICLGLFVFYFTAVIRENFADFLTICLGGLCGVEFIIFLCMCIAVTFSLHEFEFKAKWEELKRKRRVMKARKAKAKAPKVPK